MKIRGKTRKLKEDSGKVAENQLPTIYGRSLNLEGQIEKYLHQPLGIKCKRKQKRKQRRSLKQVDLCNNGVLISVKATMVLLDGLQHPLLIKRSLRIIVLSQEKEDL